MKRKKWYAFKKKTGTHWTGFESSKSWDSLISKLKRGYELVGPFDSLIQTMIAVNEPN